MAAASGPTPPGQSPTYYHISKPALFCRTLSRAAFLGAAVFAFLCLVVVYRLWALSTSQLPSGFPLGWLFDIGGWAIGPFKDTDTQIATKPTGYVEFPALVALEVFLVSTLICAVFGYFLSLFVHVEKSPRLADAVSKQAGEPRLRPLVASGAARGVTAARSASAAGIAALQRPDWARYRSSTSKRLSAWSVTAVGASKQAWARYVNGVSRDWAWLEVKWLEFRLQARPRTQAAKEWLAHLDTEAASHLSAAWLAVRRSGSRAGAVTSSAYAAAGRGLQRGSGWYWGNFDAASNRFAGMASRVAARDKQPRAEDLITETETKEEAEQPPLSRREFLRKVMPNR